MDLVWFLTALWGLALFVLGLYLIHLEEKDKKHRGDNPPAK